MGPRRTLGSQDRGVSFRSFRSTASAASNSGNNGSSVAPMPPVPSTVMMNGGSPPQTGGMRLPTLKEKETLRTFGQLHDDDGFGQHYMGASTSTRSGLFHGGVVTKLEDPVAPDDGNNSIQHHQDFPAELMYEKDDHVAPLPVLDKPKPERKKKRKKLFSFLFKSRRNANVAPHMPDDFVPQRKDTASSNDGTIPTILSSSLSGGSVVHQGTSDNSSSDDELDDVSRADDDTDSLAPVRPDRRRRANSQDSDGSLASTVPSTDRGSSRGSRKGSIERPSLAYRITPPDSGVGRGGRPRSHRREDRSGGDGSQVPSSSEHPTSVAPTTATTSRAGADDDDDDDQTQRTSRGNRNDDDDDMTVASAAIVQFSPTAGVSKIRPIVTMVESEGDEGDSGVVLSLPRQEMKKATMVDSVTPTVCERSKSEGAAASNRLRSSSHHSRGSHTCRRASASSIGSLTSLPVPPGVLTNAAGMPIPQPARRRSLSGIFRRRKSWGLDSQGHQPYEDDCSQSAVSTKSGGAVSTRSACYRRQGHQANADGDFQVPPQDEPPRLQRRNSLRRFFEAMGESTSMLFGSRRSVTASKRHHQMAVGNDGEDDGSWMGSYRGDVTITSESMGTSGRGTMYASSIRGDDNCSVGGISRLSETESTSESYHHDDGRTGKRSASRRKGKKGASPIQESPKDEGGRRRRQMAADRSMSVPALSRAETR